MKIWFCLTVFAVLIGSSLPLTPDAWACSCMQMSEQEAFQRSDVSFVGTITEIEQINVQVDKFRSVNYNIVTFDIHTELKGEFSGDTINIQTVLPDGGNCGMFFDDGKTYIVFAYFEQEQLTTNICSGNNMVSPDYKPEYLAYSEPIFLDGVEEVPVVKQDYFLLMVLVAIIASAAAIVAIIVLRSKNKK